MTRGIVAERVRVRELRSQEGSQLLRIVRRDSGSVVTWRRAQMVLLAAQGMPAPRIAEVTFASEDRVRDVIHNFNLDGFDSLYPRYQGGRPPTFTLAQRQRIKKLALSQAAYQRLDAAGNDQTAVFAAIGEMLFWIVYGQWVWGVLPPPRKPQCQQQYDAYRELLQGRVVRDTVLDARDLLQEWWDTRDPRGQC